MTFDKFMAQKEFPKPREDFAGFMCFVTVTFACWPLWAWVGFRRLIWYAGLEPEGDDAEHESDDGVD